TDSALNATIRTNFERLLKKCRIATLNRQFRHPLRRPKAGVYQPLFAIPSIRSRFFRNGSNTTALSNGQRIRAQALVAHFLESRSGMIIKRSDVADTIPLAV